MKLVILAFTLVRIAVSAETAKLSIGVVDLQKALQTVDAGKKAKAQLEKEVSAKKLELEKKQKAIQTEAEQFEKKAAILNDTAKAQKHGELQKKAMEWQKEAQESQMEFQKKERDLTLPILNDLRSIAEAIGKEKGLQLIVEKNESGVLFSENGSDQTDLVIERFDKKKKK